MAFKMIDKDWHVKTTRCSKKCGRCCMVHPTQGSYFPLNEDGSCSKLIREGNNFRCYLGMEKPLACVLTGEPSGDERKRFKCSIRYKKVK